MFYKEDVKIQLKDFGKNGFIKNRAILEMFENVATYHSDSLGHGPNNIEKTGSSWVLLDWKFKVIKRPKYGQNLNVCTWGRCMKKAFTYRDFEIRDKENNLCVIGTSKWVLVDINTNRIVRLDEQLIEDYEPEEKSVFGEELTKLKVPEKFESEYIYKVARRDIDLNGHMHNLYYLDLAYEALPQEVYEKRPFDNVRIEYKKEIKFGETIKCKYSFINGENIVTIFNEDCSVVHAIIILK